MSEDRAEGLEYRKTATIRAVQFTQKMADAHILDDGPLPNGVHLAGASYHRERREIHDSRFVIKTLEGNLAVSPGDWIATGVQGEHWAIKPDVFASTYALAQHDQARPGVEGMRPAIKRRIDRLTNWAQAARDRAADMLSDDPSLRAVGEGWWRDTLDQPRVVLSAPALPTTIRGGREEIARLALAEAIAGGFVTTRSKGDPDPTKRTASFSVRFSGAGCAQRADAVYDSLQALLALPASIGVGKEGLGADLSKLQPALPHANKEVVGGWICTRCGRDEIDARANGCTRGPCPMVPR